MISEGDALKITESAFPYGPEALALKLGISIERSKNICCDGWFVCLGNTALIRVNANVPPTRQRFTLAHELAHLILGTKSSPIRKEAFQSDKAEERAADRLAAAMLVPKDFLRSQLELPIDARMIYKCAKKAEVSPLMLVCRVAGLAAELNLINAIVISFDERGKYLWQYSKTLTISPADAEVYIRNTLEAAEYIHRSEDGKSVTLSSIVDTTYSRAVFAQKLPIEIGRKLTFGERLNGASRKLFEGDPKLAPSLGGSMGGFFHKHVKLGMNAQDCVAAFIGHYQKSWAPERIEKLKTPHGQEYLGLWFEKKLDELAGF